MTDRELLELIAAQVGTLTNDVAETKKEMSEGFKEANNRFENLEDRMIKMENDNHKNFTALFDGYKQNADKLDRIEKEVSKQEEVIIRKIK